MEDKRRIIICVCGPSGSGKSTFIKYLLLHYLNSFQLWPSITNREKRDNERNGDPYFFFDDEVIKKMIDTGDFIEYELQPSNQKYYGKTHSSLNALTKEKIILTEIQITKVKDLKEKLKEYRVFSIFLAPQDLKLLNDRMINRGDDKDMIEKRNALQTNEELGQRELADYQLSSVQDDVSASANQLLKILDEQYSMKVNG